MTLDCKERVVLAPCFDAIKRMKLGSNEKSAADKVGGRTSEKGPSAAHVRYTLLNRLPVNMANILGWPVAKLLSVSLYFMSAPASARSAMPASG